MKTKKSARILDTIPLFEAPPETAPTVVKGKLELKLRTMEVVEELQDLPRSTQELLQVVLHARQRKHEAIYRGVLAYLKLLEVDPGFYRKLNFRTIDEFNVAYGVGSGETLAKQVANVKLFERQTFVLVGDYLLNEMTREILTRQQDHGVSSRSALKRDIQRIFECYCERYDKFDRSAFRATIQECLREQSPPKPRPKPTSVSPSGNGGSGERATATKTGPQVPFAVPPTPDGHRGVRLKAGSTSTPTMVLGSLDENVCHRVVEVERCSSCLRRDEVIRQLVKIVRELKGEHLLAQIEVPHSIKAFWESVS